MKVTYHESDNFTKNEITIRTYMDHKQWLDNEYSQWIAALNESTVHNFKEHPMVKRMLGEPNPGQFVTKINAKAYNWKLLHKIDDIGKGVVKGVITPMEAGLLVRYVYYAEQILKRNPSSICEIGGGVGQFYAILRALGWEGEYCIYDLPEVGQFQNDYLAEVQRQTGLHLDQHIFKAELLVSFYALGEFDNNKKEAYEPLINQSVHGYIAWNPHSGANDDLSLFSKHQITVTPGVEEGIKIITW